MSYGLYAFSICPLRSLVISFRVQNWRRGWDPKSRPRVKVAAVVGNIGPFDEKSEKFSDYADRFEAANDIDNEKKVNVFLAVIGADAYKLLRNLCDPENPNIKSFTRLSQLLQQHFQPTPIVIAERHKFWTASQEEGECVSEFVVRLKKLPSTSSFGAFLSQSLRDRLVSGLHPKMSRTQRHILSIRELTYSMAHDKCIADEMAGKANIEPMGDSAHSDAEVQQVSSRRSVEHNSKRADKYKSCGCMQMGMNRIDSDMPDVITARRRVISAQYVRPICHNCSLKEDQVVKT